MKVFKSIADVNAAIKNQLNDKEKIDFENGLKFLDPHEELRKAFERLLPGKSPAEIEIMISPEKYR
jgi:hypothetical protein